VLTTRDWLPPRRPVDVVLTSGASCPDAILDDVLRRITSFVPGARGVEEALAPFPAAAS
jgi:4-hydroxy-3-methylbut-2-enyl diphosphate reductase